jgi:signal peptidase II
MKIKNYYWLLISLVIVSLDQLTKWLVVEHLFLYQQFPIFNWLNIVYVHNYGAAFSFLNIAGGGQRWFFALLSLLVSCLLIIWLLRGKHSRCLCFGISLIIGGALGNLWGRLVRGYVVDFIDVHWASYHWPAFNVADSAVTVGAIVLLWQLFIKDKS